MGIIFQDNFETGNLTAGGWSTNLSNPLRQSGADTSTPAVTDKYIVVTGLFNCYFKKTLSQAYPFLFFRWFWIPTNTTAGETIKLLSGTTLLGVVYRNSNGSFSLKRGSTVIAGPSAQTFPTGKVYVLEVFYDPDPADGRFELRVNGQTILNYSGNTVPSSQTTLNAFDLNADWATAAIDNIMVDDTTWVGVPIPPAIQNDWASDPACLAAYEYDYFDGTFSLSHDSSGVNMPIRLLYSANLGFEYLSPLKGLSSLRLTVSRGMAWDDNCPDGFPFKSNDTTKIGSYTFYWRASQSIASSSLAILTKALYSPLTGSFQLYATNGYLKLRWVGVNNTMYDYPNICPVQMSVLYHIGLVIDGKNKQVRIRVWDSSTGIATTYTVTPSVEIKVDSTSLMLNNDGGASGGLSGVCGFAQFTIFKRLLTDEDIDAIRQNQYGVVQAPDPCVSLTTCASIFRPPNGALSLTTCEGITLPRPADSRSLTLAPGLWSANPVKCVSKTRCQDIVFDGGDFFLTF
jgi:hypothetical protein